jgi:hypothetical protein
VVSITPYSLGYVKIKIKFVDLTGYCYGVVSHKISDALRPFSYLLRVSSRVLIFLDSSTKALWKIPVDTPSSEVGETWLEIAMNLADEIPLILNRVDLRAVKSYDMRPTVLRPLRKKSCYGFLSLLKSAVFGRV